MLATRYGCSNRKVNSDRALCLVRAVPPLGSDCAVLPMSTSSPLAQGADEPGQSSSFSLPKSVSVASVACNNAVDSESCFSCQCRPLHFLYNGGGAAKAVSARF